MSKLANKSVTRKRNADKTQRRMMLGMIGVCLFCMAFVMFTLTQNKSMGQVAVIDVSNKVHKADIIPFGNAEKYHRHLMNQSIDGIYRCDKQGLMNNYLEVIANEDVYQDRLAEFDNKKTWYKDRSVIQQPSVKRFKTQFQDDSTFLILVKLELITDAMNLSGAATRGVEKMDTMLVFKKNPNLSEQLERPWILTEYKEKIHPKKKKNM